MTSLILVLSLLNVAVALSPHPIPFKVRPVVLTPAVHRIYGGISAEDGQFPFMIFALMNIKNMGISKCSSSLISSDWVLLAAHCIYFPALSPRDILLVGGKADMRNYVYERLYNSSFYSPIDEVMLGVQERRARKFFVHPAYSEETLVHDIGLVRLERPFRLGPVQTIPLSMDKITAPKLCTVLGWGLSEGNFDSNALNFVEGKKISTTEIGCRFNKTGSFICLSRGGGGICTGDSGSPMVCDDKVWGVASHYVSFTAAADCGESLEEYYVQLHPDREWITDIVGGGPLSISTSSRTLLLCLLVALWALKAKV